MSGALLAASASSSGFAAEPIAPPPSLAPWSAPASPAVITEERTFQSAGAALSGTLYMPQGGKALGAVVVLHSASAPLRTAPLYSHLEAMLPPLGVAVFVYDRRGSGKSGGDLKTSDYALLADDAIAAAAMLGSDPRIDPNRIGVWGLSQGGWLSLLAASRSSRIHFAVSVSAPLVTPDVQMAFSSTNHLLVNGYPQAEIDQMIAARKAVDDYMRGDGDRATAQRLVDGIKVKPWFRFLYMDATVEDRETSRWRKEIEHNPLDTLESVRVPALVMFGAADPVVPVAVSVQRLRALSPGHPKLEVAVVASADHGMQTSVDSKTQLEPRYAGAEAPEAPEYFAILASWLTKSGVARGLPPNP